MLSMNAEGLPGVPAKLVRLGPAGAPRPVADDVTFADWDGERSEVVVRRVNGAARLEWPIGTVKATTPGWFSDVRVAPDGRRVE